MPALKLTKPSCITVVPSARCAPSRTRSASAIRTPAGHDVVGHARELVDRRDGERLAGGAEAHAAPPRSVGRVDRAVRRPGDVGSTPKMPVEVRPRAGGPAGARAGAGAGRRRAASAGGSASDADHGQHRRRCARRGARRGPRRGRELGRAPRCWPSTRVPAAPGRLGPELRLGEPGVEHAVAGLGERREPVAPGALRQSARSCARPARVDSPDAGCAPRRGRGRARPCAPRRGGTRPVVAQAEQRRALDARSARAASRRTGAAPRGRPRGSSPPAERGDADARSARGRARAGAAAAPPARPPPRARRAGRAPPGRSPAGRSPRRATTRFSPGSRSARSSGASVRPWPSSVTAITPNVISRISRALLAPRAGTDERGGERDRAAHARPADGDPLRQGVAEGRRREQRPRHPHRDDARRDGERLQRERRDVELVRELRRLQAEQDEQQRLEPERHHPPERDAGERVPASERPCAFQPE